jgi:predicted DNA-binding protein
MNRLEKMGLDFMIGNGAGGYLEHFNTGEKVGKFNIEIKQGEEKKRSPEDSCVTLTINTQTLKKIKRYAYIQRRKIKDIIEEMAKLYFAQNAIDAEICARCGEYEITTGTVPKDWEYIEDIGFLCPECAELWEKHKRDFIERGLQSNK